MGYLSPTTRQGVSSRIKRFIISFYGEVGKQRIFARSDWSTTCHLHYCFKKIAEIDSTWS